MKLVLKATLFASALALLPVAAAAPASARAVVSFDFGNVAIGYRDGYWDNGHRWHRWSERPDFAMLTIIARYHDGYHDMNHNRAPHNGWNR